MVVSVVVVVEQMADRQEAAGLDLWWSRGGGMYVCMIWSCNYQYQVNAEDLVERLVILVIPIHPWYRLLYLPNPSVFLYYLYI